MFPIVLSSVVMVSAPVVAAAEQLEDEAIAHRLTALPTWRIEDSTLICTYQFENFVESVAFVNQLVEPAEAAGHHPDVAIAYNRVTISLTTHDAGGLTDLDFDLAETIANLDNPSGDRCR
ncbi:MAG: 4a-hydroxytetrahydrobiopterin dehydratase [Leptolyngbyaceae bacterium]|nr:4a-hydroxytetrahydrobiopterin dehydratase [Leptolyngbyaceae bacterium]